MVALLSHDDAEVVVAFVSGLFGLCGLAVTGYFSYKAAHRVKTGNGQTAGQALDKLTDDVALIKLWLMEHIRDHEETRQ